MTLINTRTELQQNRTELRTIVTQLALWSIEIEAGLPLADILEPMTREESTYMTTLSAEIEKERLEKELLTAEQDRWSTIQEEQDAAAPPLTPHCPSAMKRYELSSSTGLTTCYKVRHNSVNVIPNRGQTSIMSIEEARVHYLQTKKEYASLN